MQFRHWLSTMSVSAGRRRRQRAFQLERRLFCEALESRALLAADFPEFVDPHPSAGNRFGALVVPLSTGNVVVTAPDDDAGGADAGAVYLFNGATGALISTLIGSSPDDHVGNGGVFPLANGNYVIRSPDWDNGTAIGAGAVTFGNGATGVGGVVSVSNSLVGTTSGDRIGIGILALPSGNYLVSSPGWDNGSAAEAGAVTFGNGTTGVTGPIRAANSLVGSRAQDSVGSITMLSNGNYVASSPFWDSPGTVDVGAVTFGSGTSGVTGAVSDANSLVGSTSNDLQNGIVFPLTNGNYVVATSKWDNGSAVDAGAATFGDGTSGISGTIGSDKSLVGLQENDNVASANVIALANGNYVVLSHGWNNGTVASAGAATFGNGTTGISGAVSPENSLVGSHTFDQLGQFGVTALRNGNYVVQIPGWTNGSEVGAGAATFGDGTTGVSGVVSEANSLVGTIAGSDVGYQVIELANGNYVVASPFWDTSFQPDVGAVTFGSGETGVKGAVSGLNSLVGDSPFDQVGSRDVIPLANGNYAFASPDWDSNSVTDAGAVTWGNGTTGTTGRVSAANSLVGSTIGDLMSTRLVTLTNGNYVVTSPAWDNGTIANAGAVTLGNGVSGTTGEISSANSLVGSTAEDQVGSTDSGFSSIVLLPNGNFVVLSNRWDNGSVVDAGAATFASGNTGISGVVSAANSLVGSQIGDRVGTSGVALDNGNFLIRSLHWDNGGEEDAGAVTFGRGTTGITGVVSPANSLVGSRDFDSVGSGFIFPLLNGNYLVRSPNYDTDTLENAGALTFGNGTTGVKGTINSFNSAIGPTTDAGLDFPVIDNYNETFFVPFPNVGSGIIRVGSQRDGFNAPPVIGNFGGNITYTENAAATLLTTTATVSDVDSPNFFSGKLTVRFASGGVSSDRFVIRTVGTDPGEINVQGNQVRISTVVIGTFTGGTGTTPLVVTFTGSATPPRVQTLLRNITFRNLADNPPAASRTVRATLSDGDGETVARIKQISITAVNDAPVLAPADGGTVGYQQNTAPIALLSNATVTDPDSANFAGGRLLVRIISGGNASNRLLVAGAFELDGDQVKRKSDGLVIGSRNAGGGAGTTRLEITFNTNATRALVQQLVRGIRFRTVSGTSTVQRVIEFSVTDGDGGASNKVTKTVNVT